MFFKLIKLVIKIFISVVVLVSAYIGYLYIQSPTVMTRITAMMMGEATGELETIRAGDAAFLNSGLPKNISDESIEEAIEFSRSMDSHALLIYHNDEIILEKYFNDFGKSVSDFYNLKKLDPAYRVYFGKNDYIEIEDSLEKISETFEKIEKGASKNLLKFMAEAKINYSVAMEKVVYKPGKSILELVTPGTIRRLRYFTTNIKSEVSRYFKNKKLRQLMEFPVLFLGAKPENTPAFYNIMNHADFGLGTWFPEKGGMYKVVESMIKLAKEKEMNIIKMTDLFLEEFIL